MLQELGIPKFKLKYYHNKGQNLYPIFSIY